MSSISSCFVYPAPPPTVNNLTAHQKAQLRRTTTKLTKVLGAAPQVIDETSGEYPSVAYFNVVYIFIQLFPVKVPNFRPFKALRKLQPSLSVSVSSDIDQQRQQSRSNKLKTDLAPLSSAPRPSSRCRTPTYSQAKTTLRRSTSRSRSSQETCTNEERQILEQSQSRPQNQSVPRPESFSRDSLCDSLYEPSFSIPSDLKIRREKMARVCKLLGEDVPVDLVFPSNLDEESDFVPVLDIRAPEVEPVPQLPSKPTPRKPKRKPVPELHELPRAVPQRTPFLETIVEQSPRGSYSSTASFDSASSLLTSTTSSSYRFSSSGCSSYLTSSSYDSVTTPQSASPIPDALGPYNRREFSLYMPFRGQSSGYGVGCHSEAKNNPYEHNVMRGMLDLRL